MPLLPTTTTFAVRRHMKFYRTFSEARGFLEHLGTPDNRLLVQSATSVAITALAFVSWPSEQQLLKAALFPAFLPFLLMLLV